MAPVASASESRQRDNPDILTAGFFAFDIVFVLDISNESRFGRASWRSTYVQKKTSAAATGSYSIHPWFVQLD